MLEVAFSESVAGSLQYAIGRKRGEVIEAGAVAVFCEDPAEKERILEEMQKPRVWQGGEIEGKARDVVSLHLQLDFGDISGLKADPEARREALLQLFGHYEGVTDDLIGAAQKAVSRIMEAKQIRLWIGEQDACDIAAAFWICDLLRNKDVEMQAVYLPAMQQRGNEVLRYSGAGDFEPENLSLYAEKSQSVTPEMRRYMANRWREIKEENAPLRVMLNGMLTGVAEDIFDPVLKRCMPQDECRMGMLIGRALSETRGVGDAILHLRARKWIDAGILEMMSPAEEGNPYSAVIRKGPFWTKRGR